MIILIRGLLFRFAWRIWERMKRSVMIIARHSPHTKLKLATERAGIHLRMSNQACLPGDEKAISSIVRPTGTRLSSNKPSDG
jgi:hypothetical protein